MYSLRLLFSIIAVEVAMSAVFMFAICKIKGVSNKHSIEIHNCYMVMHFVFISILILQWIGDSIFFEMAYKYEHLVDGNWDAMTGC